MERLICPPDHLHGRTSTCYASHRCGCMPCRARVAKNARERLQGLRDGTWQRTNRPADAAREHLTALRASGMTQRHIGQRSGLADITLSRITRGQQSTITNATERAILAVPFLESVKAGGRVDATGTRRRLQALVWLGYTTVEISRLLGKTRPAASRMLNEKEVTVDTRERVRALYDTVWNQSAPPSPYSTRARNMAAARGYVGPLAWDDDTIDDPGAVPVVAPKTDWLRRCDDDVIRASIAGEKPRLSPLERREVVPVLWARRWPDSRIASWTGGATEHVFRVRRQLGLAAWAQWEQEAGAA